MNDTRPTKEQTEAAIRAGWTPEEAARGYTVVDYDGTGLLQIEAIGEMRVFDSDEAACLQAVRDGVKIIPVNELPARFERRYFGWIDTKENRAAIAAYVKEHQAPRRKHSPRKNRRKAGHNR